MGAETIAVVPYSHALRLLPAYLQQLWMESNGKSVTNAGEPVAVDSGSVLWGGAGTNTQHAVFQLLHQGTVLVPVDLIGFARSSGHAAERHDLLAANLFAQAEALAFGRTADELEDSRRTGGDDPTSGDAGEPPELGGSRRAAHSGLPRCARGAVRAQRLHAGGDLGDQPLRPVGRRAGKGARVADCPGARDGLEARALARLVDQCPDSPLPDDERWRASFLELCELGRRRRVGLGPRSGARGVVAKARLLLEAIGSRVGAPTGSR